MMTEMLKPRVPDNCVIHSFRHSMRDRLRAVECPADIIDAIGGWSTDGVGQSYGRGYDLNVLGRAADVIHHPTPDHRRGLLMEFGEQIYR